MDDLQVFRKIGTELSDGELLQMNALVQREFKIPLPPQEKLSNRVFFLLKRENAVLAMGSLVELNPVRFEGKEYSPSGLMNIVSSEKGKGYGKRVVTTMKEYLVANDLAGFGFCKPENKEFYEKCGFLINTTATPRFVCQIDGQRKTNQDGQLIFYVDSSTRFMSNALSSNQEVMLPTPNLW